MNKVYTKLQMSRGQVLLTKLKKKKLLWIFNTFWILDKRLQASITNGSHSGHKEGESWGGGADKAALIGWDHSSTHQSKSVSWGWGSPPYPWASPLPKPPLRSSECGLIIFFPVCQLPDLCKITLSGNHHPRWCPRCLATSDYCSQRGRWESCVFSSAGLPS